MHTVFQLLVKVAASMKLHVCSGAAEMCGMAWGLWVVCMSGCWMGGGGRKVRARGGKELHEHKVE